MAARTTNFADDMATLLFRGVCDIFREDPAMVAATVRFRTWDGTQMDGAEVATGNMPLIRLSPRLMPNELDAQNSTSSVLHVRIECYAAGLIADDILNMWGAVQNAVVRSKPFRDTTVQCYLGGLIAGLPIASGAYRSFIEGPDVVAFGDVENPPTQFLRAVGTLVLKFRRAA